MKKPDYPIVRRAPTIDTERGTKRVNVAIVVSPSGERLASLALSDQPAHITVSARFGRGSLSVLVTALQRVLEDLESTPRETDARAVEVRRPGVPRGRTAP
jgi:hypothetical protein